MENTHTTYTTMIFNIIVIDLGVCMAGFTELFGIDQYVGSRTHDIITCEKHMREEFPVLLLLC